MDSLGSLCNAGSVLLHGQNLKVSSRGIPYENLMLIDGNDDRGIDVGLMARGGYQIGLMLNHINWLIQKGAWASRQA